MKIYMDMCSLQRPFDDKSQMRVQVEAEAVLAILHVCESGNAVLVGSDALVFETDGNPDPVRRDFAARTIARAGQFVSTTAELKARAQTYMAAGVKALDALHLASAVEAQAEFFCTCDDRLLKKARTLTTPPPRIVAPLELVMELQS